MASRSWCFTENNPEGIIDWELNDKLKRVVYAVYQHEVGEEGTPHYQGYVEFNSTVRLSYCRRLLPAAHWECRRGPREKARAYCMKDESRLDGPWEYGEWTGPCQGRRNDIWDLKAMVEKGATDKEIWDAMPAEYARYYRVVDRVRLFACPQRSWTTEVHVLYGPPNAGKTHAAVEMCGGVFYPKERGDWWDGYAAQENVIMDDYYGWLKYDDLLRLAGYLPHKVPVKGGFLPFVAKRIFITTNTHPALWYSNDKILGVWGSFTRRVTKWYWCPEKGKQFVFEDYKDFELVAPLVLPTQ